jgi:hypothetical protein
MEIKIIDLAGGGVEEEEIITNFYHADVKTKSGWANGESIAHLDWCKKEAASFIERGRNVGIVRNAQGQLALFEKGKK